MTLYNLSVEFSLKKVCTPHQQLGISDTQFHIRNCSRCSHIMYVYVCVDTYTSYTL